MASLCLGGEKVKKIIGWTRTFEASVGLTNKRDKQTLIERVKSMIPIHPCFTMLLDPKSDQNPTRVPPAPKRELRHSATAHGLLQTLAFSSGWAEPAADFGDTATLRITAQPTEPQDHGFEILDGIAYDTTLTESIRTASPENIPILSTQLQQGKQS
jgi:hypothetical protein